MLRLFSVYLNRKLLCAHGAYQIVAECKFSRRAHTIMNVPFGKGLMYNVNKQSMIYGVCIARHESTVNAVVKETASSTNSDLHLQETQKTVDVSNVMPESGLISEIPEPPIPSSITEEIIETIKLHANGEPTFSSIGLGGYGPIGLLQYYFEWAHITFDMPWWAVIALTSFIIKVATISLVIDQQKNVNKMQNFLPQITTLQKKMTEARLCGNAEEAALYNYEFQEFLAKNKLKMLPASTFLRMVVHLPVFIALRGMVIQPVESMGEGGLFWFKDLTIADPYYALPILTTLTLYIITEHTLQKSNAVNISQTMQYVIRGLPLLSFLFTMHFQAAILCHWFVANITTMLQNIALRNTKVQKYFNIPPAISHKDLQLYEEKIGFKQALTESWSNIKVSKKLATHTYADVTQFNEAGRGPLRRTYKYNPVKEPRHATAVSAMKK